MNMIACRGCFQPLRVSFADLGMSPLSNAFLKPAAVHQMERFYPLHAYVCEECFLVQLASFEAPETIFGDYVYFSSYSETWLEHARQYSESIAQKLNLNAKSLVVEIASNDGYLLKNFKRMGIQCLGVEPAANVARAAEKEGIRTLVRFFGKSTAEEMTASGHKADLIVANNVLAHVPDLHDFLSGIPVLMKPRGVATFEFPHLLKLIQGNQFDTIYHEHFSYFSLLTLDRIFARHRLVIFDAEELPTHGGSLRLYVRNAGEINQPVTPRVSAIKEEERRQGLCEVDTYTAFEKRVRATKRELLKFLIEAKDTGKSVVGYGAPAKGNTLLNYCGIRSDLVDYTVDRNPHKQNCFLPGTHIPVFAPEKIRATRPNFVMIFPWNLKDEIREQLAFISEWGGKFVVPIPELTVIEAENRHSKAA